MFSIICLLGEFRCTIDSIIIVGHQTFIVFLSCFQQGPSFRSSVSFCYKQTISSSLVTEVYERRTVVKPVSQREVPSRAAFVSFRQVAVGAVCY